MKSDQTKPWLEALLTSDLAPPELPKPLPLRGRRFAAKSEWQPPQHSSGTRPKSADLNAAQGRVESDPAPLATLTDQVLVDCQRKAVARAVVAELVDALAARLEPLIAENPRLRNQAIARLLRQAGSRWVELRELIEIEIAQRRSLAWASDQDEANADEYLGAYKPPPPPEPVRAPHSESYLRAAREIIAACYSHVPCCWLSTLDPLAQDKPPVLVDASYAASAPSPEKMPGERAGAWLLNRVEQGFDLCFWPHPSRGVPPVITSAGASWGALPNGSAWLLAVEA